MEMQETVDPEVLRAGAALIDTGGLELIRATGGDRVAFLQRLLSAKVEGLAPGEGRRNLLLTIKGQVVADLRVFMRAEDLRLVAAPGQGAPAAAALSRYAIMDDFAATVVADWRVLALQGAAADASLAAAGVAVPELGQPWAHADVDSALGQLWLVRSRVCGADGFWVWGAEAALEPLRERLASAGVPRLRPDVAEALRIVAGEPKFGAEITPDYFPMEVGLGSAIEYGKGCFLGQEPIVRIRDRGHINWRLVGLRLLDDVEPTPGDRLESEAKPKAGRVTSAGRLPGGLPVALGLVHVSVPAGAEVRVVHGEGAGARAEVVALADSA
jgi:folate-binding protein YgfZ